MNLVNKVNMARQNKIHYIVDDVMALFGRTVVRPDAMTREQLADELKAILLKRGVFKWFAVRRDLIRLKNELRIGEKMIIDFRERAKREHLPVERSAALALLKVTQGIRYAVRAMCHSPRVRAADNDLIAQDFVSKVVTAAWKK